MVKIEYPGLVKEPLPSGKFRWRVRPQGNKGKRITLPFGPDHPDFLEAYHAARAGHKYSPDLPEPKPDYIEHSVGWLYGEFDEYMGRQVKAKELDPKTRSQRNSHLAQFLAYEHKGLAVKTYDMRVPDYVVVEFLDTYLDRPGARKNVLKAIRAMYRWADERQILRPSPVANIRVSYKSKGGATPWTPEDLIKYRKRHPPGTAAHLALTLFMFTACRISDAVMLGAENEETDADGITWLSWQPSKKGSKYVSIPMLPPLLRAVRAAPVKHLSGKYLLTEYGKPFESPEGLRNRLKKWCVQAGIPDRSAHGIRKAAAQLLAHEGATQYQIMAVQGHAESKTSEIYTKEVERKRLARSAVELMANMKW